MSSVLDRDALEESPLADLHLLANELAVENFRRLRREGLIDAILAKQSGEEPAGEEGSTDEDAGDERPRRRGRRGGRGSARKRDEDPGDDAADEQDDDEDDDEQPRPRGGRSRGGRDRDRDRGRESRDESRDREPREREPREREPRDRDREPREEKVVSGVVELLGNGSGFVRLAEGETSDDDVYISAAQVKRCELVSGDRVAGPVRAPRRSERFASLIRIDTINDKPADEVAEGTRFDDLPVAFPSERIALGSEDPTLKAIEWLTPFGKGSRVLVAGPARAGKTEALRRLASALNTVEGLEVSVVLAGVRPEEIAEWKSGDVPVAGAVSFAASGDSQAACVEGAVEQGRRVASRGGDAVVLVDSLDHLSPQQSRRLMASARNIVDGGSLTVIAAATAPVGGETTVVTLDPQLASLGRFPAVVLALSGTIRPDLLVGEAGAEAIAKARAEAIA